MPWLLLEACQASFATWQYSIVLRYPSLTVWLFHLEYVALVHRSDCLAEPTRKPMLFSVLFPTFHCSITLPLYQRHVRLIFVGAEARSAMIAAQFRCAPLPRLVPYPITAPLEHFAVFIVSLQARIQGLRWLNSKCWGVTIITLSSLFHAMTESHLMVYVIVSKAAEGWGCNQWDVAYCNQV